MDHRRKKKDEDGESGDRNFLGLSTTIALQRLHDDIETVLCAYEERFAKQRFVYIIFRC